MRDDGERQLKKPTGREGRDNQRGIQKPRYQAVRTVSHLASGLEQSDIFGLWNRSPSLFAPSAIWPQSALNSLAVSGLVVALVCRASAEW